MIELNLACGKCGESLEREIYRARQWGSNFVFYCEKCMVNVKSEDLKRFEANEVKALRDKMMVEVKEGLWEIGRASCRERVSTRV